MKLKRYFVEGLAHASYMFASDGEAAVVDPKRDVDDYIDDARAAGLKITTILNTHPHADFASGFLELANRCGARVYVSDAAPTAYKSVSAKEGDRIHVGALSVKVLHTPGHSPDSLSFLVEEDGQAAAIFTGDLLFVGDVGRPDLRDADEDPRSLADKLYDSLFYKILPLPDNVKVYPAHGAGSLCGRAIASAPHSTVAEERANNWALQIANREEFVERMVSNLPDRPAYFSFDVAINLKGARPLSSLPKIGSLTEGELREAAAAGAAVIDTRSAPFFGAGHFPGSLNIGLASPLFSTWAGFLTPGDRPIALVVGSAENAPRARLELARIGFDNVIGYAQADSLTDVRQLSQLSVCDLKREIKDGAALQLIDVRTAGEWESGHIPSATHIPLPTLAETLSEWDKERRLAVVCGSGYRSSLAASLMLADGFLRVHNVMGGMAAYLETRCPGLSPADLVFRSETTAARG